MTDPTTSPAPSTGTSTTAIRMRAALDGVQAYRPGKPPTARSGQAYKMSSNENCHPPLPSVLDAVAAAASHVNRYPDMGLHALRERLASRIGVSADEVVPGAGSAGLLAQLVSAAVDPGDEVVYAWRSFELYPILVATAGGRSVPVPLTPQGRHDLPAMARAVTDRTRLLLVCSPNNPTGPAVGHEELAELLRSLPSHLVVALDEAYLEFRRDAGGVDARALYDAHPNLVLLRTFSKAYGLAGLRIGYAVARGAIADGLRKTALPFAVTDIAVSAALASLDASAELEVRVEGIVAERERVATALREQGWPVPDTQGNFVWLPLGERALAFAEAAGAAGLSVRPFDGDGVRCSFDVPEANDRLLEVSAQFRR